MPDCRVINSEFKPAWWLRHRHLQTIWPSLPWAFLPTPDIRREPLELPDGDTTAIDWMVHSEALPESAPILVILHGLESSARSSYARMVMVAAASLQWRSCVLHFRDCGDYRNRLPRRYHAGETNDIRFFLETLVRTYGAAPILAAGYSLGGNVLLKYLGEVGHSTPLSAATAICVPLDLHQCADALNKGFSRVYQYYLLNNMRKSLRRKFDRYTAAFDWERAMRARTFADFDDAVTAPLHGFDGMTDYYDRCSADRFLDSIGRPTLILNARDDPFMTPQVIPKADRLSEWVTLEVSEAGGHVGFIEGGSPWNPRYYLPRRIIEFLQSHL